MLDLGGVSFFEKQSKEHSDSVYSLLNKYDNYVILPVEKYSRSRMNIVFNFKNEKHENLFINEALNKNIIGINGHRSVGGIRISLYNSIDKNMLRYLLDFMESFFKKL